MMFYYPDEGNLNFQATNEVFFDFLICTCMSTQKKSVPFLTISTPQQVQKRTEFFRIDTEKIVNESK